MNVSEKMDLIFIGYSSIEILSVRCDPADFEFDIDDKHDKSKKYSEVYLMKFTSLTFFEDLVSSRRIFLRK